MATYTRAHATWVNDEDGGTEADADAFNTIEAGIDAVYKLPNAAGELIYGSAADTLAGIAAGTTTQVLHGGTGPTWSQIVNADVGAAAAIAYSKLNLALSIVNADIATAAAIDPAKFAGQPAVHAYLGANQTGIVTATATKVSLGAEEFDTNSNFDSVTNFRFLPTKAGYYQVTGSLSVIALGDTKRMIVFIYKNGASIAEYQINQGAADDIIINVNRLVAMNGTTDYLELWGRHDHGSDRSFQAGVAKTFLDAHWVRPL